MRIGREYIHDISAPQGVPLAPLTPAVTAGAHARNRRGKEVAWPFRSRCRGGLVARLPREQGTETFARRVNQSLSGFPISSTTSFAFAFLAFIAAAS
jgi:hypothetical protein